MNKGLKNNLPSNRSNVDKWTCLEWMNDPEGNLCPLSHLSHKMVQWAVFQHLRSAQSSHWPDDFLQREAAAYCEARINHVEWDLTLVFISFLRFSSFQGYCWAKKVPSVRHRRKKGNISLLLCKNLTSPHFCYRYFHIYMCRVNFMTPGSIEPIKTTFVNQKIFMVIDQRTRLFFLTSWKLWDTRFSCVAALISSYFFKIISWRPLFCTHCSCQLNQFAFIMANDTWLLLSIPSEAIPWSILGGWSNSAKPLKDQMIHMVDRLR